MKPGVVILPPTLMCLPHLQRSGLFHGVNRQALVTFFSHLTTCCTIFLSLCSRDQWPWISVRCLADTLGGVYIHDLLHVMEDWVLLNVIEVAEEDAFVRLTGSPAVVHDNPGTNQPSV